MSSDKVEKDKGEGKELPRRTAPGSGPSSRNSSASPTTKRSKSKKDLAKDKSGNVQASGSDQGSPSSTPSKMKASRSNKGLAGLTDSPISESSSPDLRRGSSPSHRAGQSPCRLPASRRGAEESDRVAETVDFFMSGSFDDNSIEFSISESDTASTGEPGLARQRPESTASLSDLDDDDDEDPLAAASDVDTNDETDEESDPSLRVGRKSRMPIARQKSKEGGESARALKSKRSTSSITRSESNVSIGSAGGESRASKAPQIVFKEIPQFVPGSAPRTQLISLATVDGLLSMLADQTAFQDKSFIDTCILTYEYYMDSARFLRKVLAQYQSPRLNEHASWTVAGTPDTELLRKARAEEQAQLQQHQQDASQPESNAIVVFQLRIVNVLKKLIETRYYSLRKDKKAYTILSKFVKNLSIKGDEKEKGWANHLRQIMKHNTEFIRAVATDHDAPGSGASSPARGVSISLPADKGLVGSSSSGSGLNGGAQTPLGSSGSYLNITGQKSLNDFTPKDLAKHLTLIDYENWVQIKMEEFYHTNFAKEKDKDRLAPGIAKAIKRFNDVSSWVSSAIVLQPKKRTRVSLLTKFIHILEELRRLRNFHGMMAFFSALSSHAIERLKKTWREVPAKTMAMFGTVAKFMDRAGSHKTYRDYLKTSEPPAIPYLGFILSDLVYSEEFPTFRDYLDVVDDLHDKEASNASSQDLDDTGGSTDDSSKAAKEGRKDSSSASGSSSKTTAKKKGPLLPPDSGSGAEEEYSQPDLLVVNASGVSPRGKSAPTIKTKGPAPSPTKVRGSEPKARYVNWVKMTMLAHTLCDILRFQRTPFVFPDQKAEVLDFVADLSRHSWFLSDTELAEMSKNIEPDSVDSPVIGSSSEGASTPASSATKPKPKTSKKQTGKKTPQYEDLTRDQALFNKFKDHLAQRFNAENLLFFESVHRFKNLDFSQHAEVRARADDIHKKFITGEANNADLMVGISPTNARDIKKFLDSNEITPLLFDRALEEVEHVTLKPSFGEFLRAVPS